MFSHFFGPQSFYLPLLKSFTQISLPLFSTFRSSLFLAFFFPFSDFLVSCYPSFPSKTYSPFSRFFFLLLFFLTLLSSSIIFFPLYSFSSPPPPLLSPSDSIYPTWMRKVPTKAGTKLEKSNLVFYHLCHRIFLFRGSGIG